MIVWLASYPRSGNHLLRTILQRCFDLKSYEIYQQVARPMDPDFSAVIGAQRFDEENVEAFISRARASPDLFLVKTHGEVLASDRCIYIVRDARAALVSYQRYLQQVVGEKSTLPGLIGGKHWPGKWHVHVRRSLSRDRENTLILRYEELASAAPPLEEISRFLRIDPIRPFDISFADLREVSPSIFPVGNNDVGIDIIERGYSWLFWRHCGEMMRALGYVPHPGEKPGDMIEAFFSHPARYVGAIIWPALRSRLSMRQKQSQSRTF